MYETRGHGNGTSLAEPVLETGLGRSWMSVFHVNEEEIIAM